MKTDQDMRNFARNVKPGMRALGLSTTTLAARAGVSTKTLNNALNARHAAQSDVLSAIAAALKTPLWELLLPDLPDDIAHDDTLPQLLKTVSQLGAEARRNVAHIADLELSKNRRG